MRPTRAALLPPAVLLAAAVLAPTAAASTAAEPGAGPGPVSAARAATDAADATDADDQAAATVWSVVPATADGPDGRRVIDLELGGGESAVEHIAVTNRGSTDAVFVVAANDGYLTRNGIFDILPSATPPTAGGSWIEVGERVEVPAGETAVVPFTVDVPARATPGDHPAGVTASVFTESAGVAVENRVGVRVNLRVSGDAEAALLASAADARYTPSWNPFSPGRLEVRYEVANDGNARVEAGQQVTTAGPFGLGGSSAGAPEGIGEVLPGGTREAVVEVSGVWPLGRVTTEITVTGEAAPGTGVRTATITVTNWVLPWPQLLLLAALVLLAGAVRTQRRRQRRRLERMLTAAREEGAAEARQKPQPAAGRAE